jgi:hypothetical protein
MEGESVSTDPHKRQAALITPRRAGLWLLSISIAGLLAAMPSASAASTPGVTPAGVTPVAVTVSSGELANLDVSALGLESSQLASALARIPALGALPTGTLQTVLGLLPSNASLTGLLTLIEGLTGVKVSIGEVTQVVIPDTLADPSGVTHLFSGVASLLEGTPQAGQLAQVLENLLGGLDAGQLQQLANQLGIGGGDLAELATALEQKLANGELLPALEGLLAQLGSPLATTAEQLESALGTTPAKLAEELGVPESVLNTLTGIELPLGISGLLTALVGKEGVTIGTLPPNETVPGSGGSSSNTSTSSTTNSSTSTTVSPAPTATTTAAAGTTVTLGKVKILSHKVKGHTLTLVVKTPSPGKLTVTAAHAKRVSKKVAKAGTTTLKVPLTKAGIASAKRHHKLNVQVKVAFKPTSGAASSAVTRAHFR